MDQSASLRCQVCHALLLDCRDGSSAQVPFDLSAHGLALLVMDTRAEHALVDGQYSQRRASCEQAARLLGVSSLREVALHDLDQSLERLPEGRIRARARHVVTEIDASVPRWPCCVQGAPAMWAHCWTPPMSRCATTLRSLRRARRRGRDGNGPRRPWRQDDRRGIRRVGHRSGARRARG